MLRKVVAGVRTITGVAIPRGPKIWWIRLIKDLGKSRRLVIDGVDVFGALASQCHRREQRSLIRMHVFRIEVHNLGPIDRQSGLLEHEDLKGEIVLGVFLRRIPLQRTALYLSENPTARIRRTKDVGADQKSVFLYRHLEKRIFGAEVGLIEWATDERPIWELLAGNLADRLTLLQSPLLTEVGRQSAAGFVPHLSRVIESF
jgi:hypothetical protein